jgi:hypothetical protein
VPEEWWKTLPGLEKLLCPLSEQLYQSFAIWTADYIFSGPEFTQLFEEFELLASLALLTMSGDLENLKARRRDIRLTLSGRRSAESRGTGTTVKGSSKI